MFLGERRPIMAAFVHEPVFVSMHHVSLLLLLVPGCPSVGFLPCLLS